MEMLAQARAELPNECCGILAGRLVDSPAGPSGQVERRYPLVNAAASPREYVSEPRSHFAADREMRSLGIDVLAVYHSHPTSPPVPSKKDRERNYGPNVIHLIISLETLEISTRAWWLTAEDYREADWELAPPAN
jgi:proteasome lid subunit RPN8/RPN11